MCETRNLAKRENILINQCIDCKTVYLWCNNLVLTFTEEEFMAFGEVINSFDFKSHSVLFPDNITRAMIFSPNPDISFTFTSEELSALNSSLAEAFYMLEVYKLIEC
ncbi:hypothetical protein D3C86_1638920 [compost metagenome]